ncbi:MAG: MBL fold metallo-hydrolase [Prevotellaceae bacterium]|jgi:phosphoribosyl 1,2-cyclic phosphate phosphodiesterase|nr:MBL fold metallo-hydrolase [Prevotellaceae bacterium]
MKITFLGTGTSQGTPVIGCNCKICKSTDARDKRLRSSVLIETHDRKILIDAGPDFRQQMLSAGITNLDAILITHAHFDHIGGLDDVRALNYIRQKAVDIYVETRVQKALSRIFYYAFDTIKYPGVPEFTFHKINENSFNVVNVKITPVRAYHRRLPVLGFKIDNFCYITDANRIAPKELKKMQYTDTVVINALRREKHLSHFCLSEALEIIDKIKPRQAYLTHISHQLDLHSGLEKELPENVFVAFDGLSIYCG